MLEVDFNCAFLRILAHDVPSKSNSDGFLELDLSSKYIFLTVKASNLSAKSEEFKAKIIVASSDFFYQFDQFNDGRQSY